MDVQVRHGDQVQKLRLGEKPVGEQNAPLLRQGENFLLPGAFARQDKMNFVLMLRLGHGFHKHILPLFDRQPSGHQDQEFPGEFVGFRQLPVRKIRVDAVGNDVQLRLIAGAAQFPGDKIAGAMDVGAVPV